MRKVYKKSIAITGAKGLLGSYFKSKYSNKYKIISYPHRVEDKYKFKRWIKDKKFDYFIHFAGINRNNINNSYKNLKLINETSSINILKELNSLSHDKLKFCLFISSSHVYNFSKLKIKENFKKLPNNHYGKTKLNVENFIIKNRKKFFFKVGIARIFNTTGKNQRKGYIVPDLIKKINENKIIKNLNVYRDFIHPEDIVKSIDLIISRRFTKPVNVCSGNKINLIDLCKIINKYYTHKKTVKFDFKRGGDLFGNNNLLKSIGIKKFKNIHQIIREFKK